ncbi:hypothetical protein Tco_0375477 [Tanacetum coccineum]
MFDEYFTSPSIVVSLVQEANAPRVVVLADSPVSTSIDQDAPSSRSLCYLYIQRPDLFYGSLLIARIEAKPIKITYKREKYLSIPYREPSVMGLCTQRIPIDTNNICMMPTTAEFIHSKY